MSDQDKDKSLFCSFCGKNQHEVKKLIAGPSVFICDECIDLCTDIIKEEIKAADSKKYVDLVDQRFLEALEYIRYRQIFLSQQLLFLL